VVDLKERSKLFIPLALLFNSAFDLALLNSITRFRAVLAGYCSLVAIVSGPRTGTGDHPVPTMFCYSRWSYASWCLDKAGDQAHRAITN
jgi:hypothetical protein